MQHYGSYFVARRTESPKEVTTSYATASRCVTMVPFSWRDGQNHQVEVLHLFRCSTHTHKLTHHHPSITLILPLPFLLFCAQSKSRKVGNMWGYPVPGPIICFYLSIYRDLSISLSITVCLSVCLSLRPSILPSVRRSVCLLSVCLSVCCLLSVCLSVRPSLRPSICLSVSVCLSACLPACLSVRLPVCLSACLTACLPACLSLSLSFQGLPFSSSSISFRALKDCDRGPFNGGYVCFQQQCVAADTVVARQLIAYTRACLDALSITEGATHAEVGTGSSPWS